MMDCEHLFEHNLWVDEPSLFVGLEWQIFKTEAARYESLSLRSLTHSLGKPSPPQATLSSNSVRKLGRANRVNLD